MGKRRNSPNMKIAIYRLTTQSTSAIRTNLTATVQLAVANAPPAAKPRTRIGSFRSLSSLYRGFHTSPRFQMSVTVDKKLRVGLKLTIDAVRTTSEVTWSHTGFCWRQWGPDCLWKGNATDVDHGGVPDSKTLERFKSRPPISNVNELRFTDLRCMWLDLFEWELIGAGGCQTECER